MAIFRNLETLKKQISDEKFKNVFEYLTKVIEKDSSANKRIYLYDTGTSQKIEICNNSFAFEQVYMTKDRKECFFESHKKYIDIQFVLDGEEQIEVENISNLEVYKRYDPEIDLIKYKHKDFVSKIILKNGEGIVLFPEDGHMPSVKVNETSKVLKVVIKLEV